MSSPITNFYKSKSVFITGGTGFLGKVMIEKLLYSCRNLKNIYMHIKPKHGKDINDRMAELLNSQIFERIRNTNPSVLKKIIPIAGNLVDNNLGISNKDLATLYSEVSIVFHVAATVKLDIELRPAIDINTRGTQKIVEICKKMHNLQGLVYVSTAYSNCPNNIIREEVYDTANDGQIVYNFLDTTTAKHSKALLGEKPTAYTYSKALAESYIAKEAAAHDFPATIVRPSLILSSAKEPMPGWMDPHHGTSCLIMSINKGTIRCVRGDSTIIQDIIPADYVANLCIAAAWDLYSKWQNGDKQFKVFNCCSGLQNPITQAEFFDTCLLHGQGRIENIIPKPSLSVTKSRFKYNLFIFFLETLPSFLIHIWETILGRASKLLKLHKISRKVAVAGEYFLMNEFTFIDTNVRKLQEKLVDNDKKIFNFNIKDINWNSYLKDYVWNLESMMGFKNIK